jgi:single-strand DNA-binding protein
MFETPITVVGRIVGDLRRRRVADQEVISFRLASNSRRRVADGSWEAGNSLFITVNCWGKLVTGVGASLGKGNAVIAVGHVYTSEYQDRDGNKRSSLEMRATSVGPDLLRSIARIIDVNLADNNARPAPVTEDPEENDDESVDDAEPDETPVDGRALPLPGLVPSGGA